MDIVNSSLTSIPMSSKINTSDTQMINKSKANTGRKSVRSKSKQYIIVSYGPLNVRVCTSVTPTLKTGRCSKFIKLEGEEAIKREIRRHRNRETARKLKEKRMKIEHQLVTQIGELESVEKNLLQCISSLQLYKQFLDERYQNKIKIAKEMNRTASFKSSQVQRNTPVYYERRQMKIEPRSPSPF